jgi:hypothetical protein
VQGQEPASFLCHECEPRDLPPIVELIRGGKKTFAMATLIEEKKEPTQEDHGNEVRGIMTQKLHFLFAKSEQKKEEQQRRNASFPISHFSLPNKKKKKKRKEKRKKEKKKRKKKHFTYFHFFSPFFFIAHCLFVMQDATMRLLRLYSEDPSKLSREERKIAAAMKSFQSLETKEKKRTGGPPEVAQQPPEKKPKVHDGQKRMNAC